MHFQHTFWIQSIRCPSLINTIFPMNIMVWWYCEVPAKFCHPYWCIKVQNSPARLLCWWIILIFLSSDMIVSVMFTLKFLLWKKTLQALFMNGAQLPQDYKASTKRQITFYHSVPRTSWHLFSWPQNDERLSWPWRHSAVLNLRSLNWESRTLTTWPLHV